MAWWVKALVLWPRQKGWWFKSRTCQLKIYCWTLCVYVNNQVSIIWAMGITHLFTYILVGWGVNRTSNLLIEVCIACTRHFFSGPNLNVKAVISRMLRGNLTRTITTRKSYMKKYTPPPGFERRCSRVWGSRVWGCFPHSTSNRPDISTQVKRSVKLFVSWQTWKKKYGSGLGLEPRTCCLEVAQRTPRPPVTTI